MKFNLKNTKKVICGVVCAVLFAVSAIVPNVSAEGGAVGFTMSPLSQKLILQPGETYTGSFRISVPSNQEKNFNYAVTVQPFYVNEQYKPIFDEVGDYSLMKDWITINSAKTGTVEPNKSVEIVYTINVPLDAAAGGQYAAISVGTDNSKNTGDTEGFGIQEQIAQAYTIFAEITGNTVRQGEILNVSVPSFLFSGKVSGNAEIKNTGNVHGNAKYILQVYPLFSNEEVYSNEEKDQDTKNIMPDRTYYNTTVWKDTPWFGIYNVVYTVEFEGVVNQVKKMVIVCPIWLLFIVIFIIVALVIWLINRSRNHKTGKKGSSASKSEKKNIQIFDGE